MKNKEITLDDLLIAYRKAKVNAYYETGHVTSIDFAEYEHNLIDNLNSFLKEFNDYNSNWFLSKDFIGQHRYALKKVEVAENELTSKVDKSCSFTYFSNSKRSWDNMQVKKIDYRIIGKHSVNFHILSSLWLENVGFKLDAKISKNSYGCRLKATNNESPDSSKKSINKDVHGHFKPYINNYQNWQRNGLDVISNSIKANKKVIAITTDLAKYYHRIDAEFLLNKDLYDLLGIELSPLDKKINHLLVEAINFWSDNVYNDTNTPKDFKFNKHSGIPMGLGASKVIANILLWELDTQIETQISPLYYGRYVDDILLVLEDVDTIKNSLDFWTFLEKRINNLQKFKNKKNNENEHQNEYIPKDGNWTFCTSYSSNSLIEFNNCKEKYFFLEGKSGESFLTILKESLDENSSEWNLPPDIYNDIDAFSEEVSKATTDNQESANGLRKSDGLSLQRLKFVLYLKRLEVSVKYLPQKQWQKPFDSFMELCIEHTITPDCLDVYTKYYPRVVGICISVNNFEYVKKMVNAIKDAFTSIKKSIDNETERIKIAENLLFDQIEESMLCNFNLSLSHYEYLKITLEVLGKNQYDKNTVSKLVSADLHRIPFKEFVLKRDKDLHKILTEHSISITSFENMKLKDLNKLFNILNFCKTILPNKQTVDSAYGQVPLGFLFYTRPFTLFELSYLIRDWHERDNFISFCRIFNIDFKQREDNSDTIADKEQSINENLKFINLDSGEIKLDKTIAFTSLETKEESWLAVVQEHGVEPDFERVERIFRLVEDILRCKLYNGKRIHYVLFPELSIPRDLLSYISHLFLKKGISVIAGMEYEIIPNKDQINQPHINNYVSNQLIYVLTVKGEYQKSHVIIRQEKEIPALQEERDLYNVGGAILRAQSTQKYIINHDGFYFAGLICNDFLDIKNRAMFRGLIDALIVAEWNKDTKTYNALVEATANDLHTCIMQVNNRKYGDTRLRIPYKEDFMKDAVRVKGGELDYFVVATLPITELRRFQRHHRSPNGPFKPVPTGYIISNGRKKL